MNDNNPHIPNAASQPLNAPANVGQDKDLDLSNVTEQNWLFIKHYLKTGKVLESYRKAGYKGEDSAAYMLMHRLKGKLEQIKELEGVNRARLLVEVDKLLDLPLDPNKQYVTLSEKLRTIKAASNLVPEIAQTTVKPSVFIINRANSQSISVQPTAANSPRENMSEKDVIDVPAEVDNTDTSAL